MQLSHGRISSEFTLTVHHEENAKHVLTDSTLSHSAKHGLLRLVALDVSPFVRAPLGNPEGGDRSSWRRRDGACRHKPPQAPGRFRAASKQPRTLLSLPEATS